MKAIVATGEEDPLVALTETEDPAPQPDEALVRLQAFGLNRSDVNRAQMLGASWRPGIDGAGVVERAAADGTGPEAGARVLVHAPAGGLAAELAAVPSTRLVALPDGIELTDAAALGLAGIVALRMLRVAGPLQGRSILMTGATGGVGQFVVPLAIAEGASVTALTPVDRPHEHLVTLGARVVHDVASAGGPFDVVLETVGGALGSQAIGAVAAQGLVLWFGQAGGEPVTLDFFRFLGPHQSFTLRQFVVTDAPGDDASDLATLVDLLASGRLAPVLGRIADWADAPAVLGDLRDRRVHGKAILTVGATA